MVPSFRSRAPHRFTVAAITIATLAGVAASPAQAAETEAQAAKRTYSALRDIGLTVRSASLKSRTLRVKVTATRPLALRFAIVRGTKQLGSAKISVPVGTTTLKLLLNQKSTGKNLKLRVTARSGNRRGRQRVGVGLIALPKPDDIGGQGKPTTPNKAPTALVLTSRSVPENSPAGSTVGNVQGTDPDPADTLTFGFATGAGDADNGAFTLSDGTLRTVAPLDFETKASYSVRLRVSDGRGGVLEQVFDIQVTNVNEPPGGLSLSSDTVPENQPVGTAVGTLSAPDPDAADNPVFTLVAGSGDDDNASFAIVGGELRTAATFDRETKSAYSVRVRATDNGGRTDERAFSITVTNVNEAPTAIALSNADVAENQASGTAVGTLSATDPDAGATAAFTLVPGAGDSDNAAFQIVGASLRTAAAFDFETKASYSVRVQADDGLGGTVAKAITIAITDADDPAVASDDSATVAEDAAATAIPVLANDSDQDDPLSIASVSDPADGTTAITGGGTGLTYTPDPNACNSPPGTAPDTFTYTLAGGGIATVSMTVTCANDAPVVTTTSGALSYSESDPATPVDAAVTVTDVDSVITSATVQITTNYSSGQDVLAYLAPLGNPVTGSFDAGTGTMTLTGPATPAQFSAALRAVTYVNTSNNPSPATRTVTVLASDGSASSAPATRDIAISATDSAPDVDNSAGALAYTENDPATAIDSVITITDSDSANLTGASVQVTGNYVQGQDVLALPAQPVVTASFDAATGTLTLSGTATVAAYESALEAITYSNSSDNPSTATRTVTYQARDAGGFGAADTHAITVTAVDDAPVAVNDSATVAEDSGASAVVVLGNDTDVDGGPKSVASVTQPGNGTVVITGGGTGLTYAPSPNACNSPPGTTPDTFTYTLNGGSTATVSMTVTCSDDAPVAVNDSATVAEDSGASAVAVLGNDTDIDGGPKSVASVTQPASGTVAITGGGTGLTYTPNANSCNDPPGTTPDTFTYTLNGGSSATVSMTVTCVNDAPVADDETFNGASSAVGNTAFVGDDPTDGAPSVTGPSKTITGDILDGDSDIDGPGPLVVTAGTFATNDGGSVVLESDGDFTFTPAAGTSCSDTSDFFDYTVSDQYPGTAGTDIGRVTITISGCVWYVSNNAAGDAGTSTAPFDTLAQAESASASGHTIYLYDGDNTTTGYSTGITLKADQRLLGEATTLQVGTDVLAAGNAAARPTLTDTNADVVELASGNTVRGLQIDPQGTGGGIAGGSGDAGGTIGDVRIVDTGTAGTQPSLELDTTSGTFDVADLTVDNSAATGQTSGSIGVRLSNAGTVTFASAGTVSITTAGAKAIDANGTSLGAGSVVDAVTVTGSATGGVSVTSAATTTGLTFGALNLTTTGGTGFLVSSAGSGLGVLTGGIANVAATNGPAIDVTGTTASALDFDTVTSSGSTGDGINLAGLGAGTFTANATSAVSNAAGVDFDLDDGTGAITYNGTITDDLGQLVRVQNTDGGTKAFTGAISDGGDGDGSGIALASNSGATIRFDGGVTVSTDGANPALSATGGGTLAIPDPAGAPVNTLAAVSAAALNVANTTIGADDLVFQSISAGNSSVAADPANGIVLNTTGSTGNLIVTGTGGTCTSTASTCTGGTIQSTTGDAVSLTSTTGVALANLKVMNAAGNGIRGTTVTGFSLTDSVLDNNADDTASGGANDEANLNMTNLGGTAAVTRVLMANASEDNARVVNSSATLTQFDVTDSVIRDTDTASPGNNGLLLQADGGSITADVLGTDFLRNRANGLQVVTNGTGSMNVEVDDSATQQSDFDDNNIGVNLAHNSSGTFGFGVRDLTIDGLNVAPGTGGSASPINVNLAAAATTTMTGKVTGNTLTNSNSTTGPGIRTIGNGTATMTVLLDSNTISQVANRGIEVIARDGSNRINATIANNNVALNNALAGDAIRVDSGAVSTDTTTICADIRGNTATTTAAGLFGIRLRQRFAGTGYILEDYAGSPTDDAAVQSFLSTANGGATTSADHAGAGFTTTADCPNAP